MYAKLYAGFILQVCIALATGEDEETSGVCVNETEDCAFNGSPMCIQIGNYMGTKNRTISGHSCQRWTVNEPNYSYYPELGDQNMCRITSNSDGPWCYRADSPTWEYCFNYCTDCVNENKDCAFNGSPVCIHSGNYMGMKHKTVSGHSCQRWNINEPNYSYYHELGDHNTCRITSNSDGPWCYRADSTTSKVKWEYCFDLCKDDEANTPATPTPATTVKTSTNTIGVGKSTTVTPTPASLTTAKTSTDANDDYNAKMLQVLSELPPHVPNGDWKADVLKRHNVLRARLAQGKQPNMAPAKYMAKMFWDDQLAVEAQAFVDTCPNDHGKTRPNNAGENIAWTSGWNDWVSQVDGWYAEVANVAEVAETDVGTISSSNGVEIGHFTQLIWANVNKLGCGYNENCGQWRELVCRYLPPKDTLRVNSDGMFEEAPVYVPGKACELCNGTCENGLCDGPMKYAKIVDPNPDFICHEGVCFDLV